MTGVAAHGVFAPGLSTRGPASSVLEECLRTQREARQRGAIARFFGRSPLHRAARAHYKDAVVSSWEMTIYSRVSPPFRVYRSIEEDSQADHLIVGPPGVFSVRTKSFSARRVRVGGAKVTVNGRRDDCVDAAKCGAADAARVFSEVAGTNVEVTPLIVVVEPRSLSLDAPDIAVTESWRVARWFNGLPRVLSDDTVDHLSRVVASSGIWKARGEANDDEHRHAQRFERLRHEVEEARHRARIWRLSSLAVLVGTAAAVVGTLSMQGIGPS